MIKLLLQVITLATLYASVAIAGSSQDNLEVARVCIRVADYVKLVGNLSEGRSAEFGKYASELLTIRNEYREDLELAKFVLGPDASALVLGKSPGLDSFEEYAVQCVEDHECRTTELLGKASSFSELLRASCADDYRGN